MVLQELLIHSLLKKEVSYSGVYGLSILTKLTCLYQHIAFRVSLKLENTAYILQVGLT